MKVVIHAGRHKTATSSIQKFLAGNEAVLAEQHGILYPSEGRDPKQHFHHPLFRSVVEDLKAPDPQIIEAAVSRAQHLGCHTVLFSSEMLSRGNLDRAHFELLKQTFTQYDLRIILYLRNQGDFLESTYANRIRFGLLSAPDRISDLDAHLDYYNFVARFADVFGKNALHVRSYDNALHRGVLVDFLEAIGVSQHEGIRFDQERANERLPWLYLALLRHANRKPWMRKVIFRRRVIAIFARMEKLAPSLKNVTRPFSAIQRKAVTDRYQRSNDRLAREFCGRDHLFGGEATSRPPTRAS
jgi:hypothetical protein